MRSLSDSELLNVWEQGLTQLPVHRALMLLAAACPENPMQQLAQLSIGQRDALLLTLREWTFGSQIQSLVTCPECGDRLELCFNISDIRVETPTELVTTFNLEVADLKIQFRLPNSLDLIACTELDRTNPQEILLQHCLLEVSSHGKAQAIEQLTEDAIKAVVTKMAQADPQADIRFNLSCPTCHHQWRSLFDIVSFFWSEIHAWAIRILQEVHILASAYGWREADILTMSSVRRQLYLEMVGK